MQSTQSQPSPLLTFRKNITQTLHHQQAQSKLDPLQFQQKFDAELANNVVFKKVGMGYAGETTFGRGRFNLHGSMWITAGADGEGKVWDVSNPNSVDFCKEVTSFKAEGNLCDVQFHPRFGAIPAHAPNFISCTSTGELSLHTFQPTLAIQSTITIPAHTSRISSMSFIPASDRHLVLTSHDFSYSIWDLSRLTKIAEQKGHEREIQTGCLHPDGALFFTGDLSGCGMMWDLRVGKGIYEIGESMSFLCSAFHPNGYELAVSGRSNLISVYDLRRKKLLRSIPAHSKQISSLSYHPQGLFLCSGSHDNLIRLWHGKHYSSLQLEDDQMQQAGKVGSVDVRKGRIGTATVDGKWSIWMNEDKVKIQE